MWLVFFAGLSFGWALGSGFVAFLKRRKSPATPVEEWKYLGNRRQEWINQQKKPVGIDVTHFWALESTGLMTRRVTYDRGGTCVERQKLYPIEREPDWVDDILPWVNGAYLYPPIERPSPYLQDWTLKTHNLKWNATAKHWEKVETKAKEPELSVTPTPDLIDSIMKEKNSD
jgi:hypothetical protein